MFAICITCGAKKNHPQRKCRSCHFVPAADEERAKSMILSLGYEIDGEYKGKTLAELTGIGEQIRAGAPYGFDQKEVDSVISYAYSVLAIPARRMVLDLLKWLAPPLMLATLFGLIIFLK